MAETKVVAQNVNHPGYQENLSPEKFMPMREAILTVLPIDERGMTIDELETAILPQLPHDVFPNGEKARWWLMAVKLDLEAKGIVERVPKSKPQRIRRIAD